MNKVFVERFDNNNLLSIVQNGLAFVNAATIIRPQARVFIKPNLTWRKPTPGVTVQPAFIKAAVEALRDYTSNITIGESEGGQACFKAEEAFESHGLYELSRTHGVRVINLTMCPQEVVHTTIGRDQIEVELASLLLHDTDVFITMPVPKIHAMTGVSLGFKNQWGCLGDKMRVTQHPRFAPVVLGINKVLNPRLCMFDGSYFLDYTGPLMGNPVPMNVTIIGDHVGATTRVCCDVMQVDPETVQHLRLAKAVGMFPPSLDGVVTNRDIAAFRTHQFRLKRAPINYIHLAAFNNRLLNRAFYDSALADGLHEFLWAIRRQKFVKRFLYGKYGPGEANRGGRTT